MVIAKFGTVKSYSQNQIISKEGKPGNAGSLVKAGQVSTYKMIDGTI